MQSRRLFKLLMFLVLPITYNLSPITYSYAQETLTITTYYPSPSGSYNSLQAYKLGVGDNNGDGNLTSADIPPTNGDVWVSGNVTAAAFLYSSDARLKENISPINNSLQMVENIEGVTFSWKDSSKGKGRQLGLIAQELEKVLPEVVFTSGDGYKSIDYAKLTPVLIEAIKEQQNQIKALQKKIDLLELRISQLGK